jgi:hypothetical protein
MTCVINVMTYVDILMSLAISYSVYMAGLSKDTVARYFEPPRKNTTAARAYKGLVDARVAPKRNNARKV